MCVLTSIWRCDMFCWSCGVLSFPYITSCLGSGWLFLSLPARHFVFSVHRYLYMLVIVITASCALVRLKLVCFQGGLVVQSFWWLLVWPGFWLLSALFSIFFCSFQKLVILASFLSAALLLLGFPCFGVLTYPVYFYFSTSLVFHQGICWHWYYQGCFRVVPLWLPIGLLWALQFGSELVLVLIFRHVFLSCCDCTCSASGYMFPAHL